ncbi:MAG TPA: hypothetical protein DCG32_05265 [Sphaerochaeta sp.]|nr:hypothetical protein [Sphaerochaeta sp.]
MMWMLRASGGIGGSTGRPMGWGLVVLPYPIGWIMGMTSLIVRLVKFIRNGKLSAHWAYITSQEPCQLITGSWCLCIPIPLYPM